MIIVLIVRTIIFFEYCGICVVPPPLLFFPCRGYQDFLSFNRSLLFPVSVWEFMFFLFWHKILCYTRLVKASNVSSLIVNKLMFSLNALFDLADLNTVETVTQSIIKDHGVVIKIIRAQRREGLIRGRLMGARSAVGDVLVFLDSHCEVNRNWLEPLLDRIEGNRKRVVCPIIDLIDSHTFRYRASPLVRGGFTWGMGFSWEPIPLSNLANRGDDGDVQDSDINPIKYSFYLFFVFSLLIVFPTSKKCHLGIVFELDKFHSLSPPFI